MKKADLPFMPEYHDRYIDLTDDVTLLDAIQTSIDEIDNLPLDQFRELGSRVYEPGKWTINDILQHLTDTVRVFTYRTLAFARKDTQDMPIFGEDDYALNAEGSKRDLDSIVKELRIATEAFKSLYESFTPGMLLRTGKGWKGEYSVASTGFMVPGHQRWHLRVINERYLPLLGK